MGIRRGSWRGAFARAMAALMLVIAVVNVRWAIGAPSDIFSSPAPIIGADPEKATDIKAGDASVSTQTGAFTYSYPIQVPPGRNGMAAQLALSYSSQAPIYGGIATGWSLSIPEIREDTSQSRLVSRSPQVEQLEADPRRDDRFVSSMAGGRPLVAVKEPTSAGVYQTYRAQNDANFARYERMDTGQTFRWRIYTPDGMVMTFGETLRVPGCVNVNDQYAPLTGVVDSFGNEVKYEYSGDKIAGECRISKISWGQNTASGIAQPFAQVTFGWGVSPSCTPPAIQPGSFRDYHSVTPDKPPIITGASKLQTITATAFSPAAPGITEHTRLITLGYDANTELCTQSHAPVRLLRSIQESAWGADSPRVDLPAVTFEYGNPTVALTSNATQSAAPWSDIWAIPTRRNNLAWGYRRNDDRWPSLEAMLLDIDGDGLLDRVTSVGANTDTSNPISSCTAKWQRNLGPNASGNIVFSGTFNTIALPRLKWRGTDDAHQVVAGAATALRGSPSYEGCSLNGQVIAYQNSVASFNCHPPTTSGSSTVPGNTQSYCFPGGTEVPHGGPGLSDYRTYLAYRWLDADGDGLTDLVAAVHGDIGAYDIERGNRVNYSGGEPNNSGIPGVGTWPACPGQIDRCKDFGTCLKGATSCTNGVCTPLWNVVNQCLISQASTGCAQVSAMGGGGGGPTPSRTPYQRCEGLYPWFIYKNQGNGNFAMTPIIKYQPVQLESQESDSAITGPAVAAENHAIVDFDGDGILDALVRDAVNAWQVYLGDGTGGFGTKRYVYITRSGSNGGNSISSQGFAPTPLVSSSAGLFDINGDGLQDHWIPSAPFNVAISDGTQHRLYGTGITPIGEIETPANVKPGSDTNYTVTATSGTGVPLAGWSIAQNRVVDVDNDGRLDVVRFTPNPFVYWNWGGQFSSTSNPYPGINDNGIKRRTEAWQTGDPGGSPETLYWELKGDLTDLDGNGIPESVFFAEAVLNRNKETSQASTTEPPRLIKAIHNGRGGHTAVTYASMHDPAATVEQHPELRFTDAFCPTTIACPKATSREQWVVKSMTVTDSLPITQSTTSYVYKNPRHSPDDRGRYGLRGFETVITTAPSLATTEQTYGYDVDWSGRLTKTIVKPKPTESSTDVRSIDKTTWEGRDLFGGAITTYHAITTEHFTCANGKTELSCTAIPAAYTRTTTTLTALASTTVGSGPTLLWQPTASLLQAGTSAAEGDRQTLSTFALAADGSTYRLRPLTQTKQSRVSGVMIMFAKSQETWDASYLVPLTSEVWLDAVDANRAITRSVYDAFGNVTERWKPVQNAANTVKTTFAYDSRKLFVATETNELGHVLDYTWEYGTGTKLSTSGPNTAGCFPNCTVDALHPPKQLHKIKTDGFGRELEHWETASSDGYVFTLSKFGDTRYVDTAVGGIPTSSTTRRMFAASGADYIQEKIELDGHGRPIKKIVFAQGSAPSDQVTVFHYRADGTLQDVQVPDPTQNNASLVTYTYTFDSLGHATSIRRPDAAAPVDQSGVDITYDGVEQTTTEYVGAAGGNRARSKTRSDSFGRLIRVDERIAASPDSFATTVYTYSPDDNVKTIVDPQNVTTQLVHDFAGRRTRITRSGGRTWTYSYDKNGNMTSERVPGSPNPPLTDPLYTTTIVYDALDRPVSKRNAPRGLSVADQALFASDHETYTWDYGPNHKGYLRYWRSYAPGATSPAILYNVFNDAQGLRTKTEHQLTIAGYPLIVRATNESHLLFGGLLTTRYYDSFGGNNATDSEVAYDKRGMPKWITLRRDGMPTLGVAAQTRNVAGLVTNRRTNTTGAMTFVESNWTYDKLGRVTRQLVQKGPGPTQVARQQLTYLGNDDPSTLAHTLGTSAKQFQFGYDQRHQLVSANETSTTGYFSSAYRYGSAGRFTAATLRQNSPPVGSELKPRDVTYQYTGTDPEQVTALINASGANVGLPFASYIYDKAGNQTSRCFGTPTTPTCAGESIAYVYDGKDQLRRATKMLNGVVQGSEEYWYDVDGQRIAVVKRDKLGNKTELVSFIRDVEAHYDGAGAITHVYSHLSLGTPVARVDRTSNTSAPVELQFHGLASNTIAAVSNTGTINASFSYAPFGEVLEATSGAGVGIAAHKRRMNDKFEDDVSGLAYYGARYYDKAPIGWTQSDPLYRFAPDSAWKQPRRAYLYVSDLNNPVRYLDPDGRQPGEVLQSGLEFMEQASQTGNKPLMVAGVFVLAGAVLVAGGEEIFATSPLAEEFLGIRRPVPPYATSKDDPPKPETGSPEDIEKDPDKGHPYRERPGPYNDPNEPPPPSGDDWTTPEWWWGGRKGPGPVENFTEVGDPSGHWKSALRAPIFSAPILRKKLPSFDIPCLSCSIFRQRMQNRIDKEAETLGR